MGPAEDRPARITVPATRNGGLARVRSPDPRLVAPAARFQRRVCGAVVPSVALALRVAGVERSVLRAAPVPGQLGGRMAGRPAGRRLPAPDGRRRHGLRPRLRPQTLLATQAVDGRGAPRSPGVRHRPAGMGRPFRRAVMGSVGVAPPAPLGRLGVLRPELPPRLSSSHRRATPAGRPAPPWTPWYPVADSNRRSPP